MDKNGYNQVWIMKHLKQMSQDDYCGDVLSLDECLDDSSTTYSPAEVLIMMVVYLKSDDNNDEKLMVIWLIIIGSDEIDGNMVDNDW